ncbi:MAG: ABC transporter permease, partial [Desulfurococcaceae archaeon]
LGVAIGAIGAHLLASQGLTIGNAATSFLIKAQPALTLELFSLAIGLTCLVGMVGGLLPAYMASKIPPAAALRYE